jgi:hypothetical protein
MFGRCLPHQTGHGCTCLFSKCGRQCQGGVHSCFWWGTTKIAELRYILQLLLSAYHDRECIVETACSSLHLRLFRAKVMLPSFSLGNVKFSPASSRELYRKPRLAPDADMSTIPVDAQALSNLRILLLSSTLDERVAESSSALSLVCRRYIMFNTGSTSEAGTSIILV